MLLHHGMKVVGDLSNLAGSEELVPAVVVEREHRGQRTLGILRFEEVRLGRRSVGQLPLQVLDVEAVVVELVLKLRAWDSPGIVLEQILVAPRLRQASPRLEVREAFVAE